MKDEMEKAMREAFSFPGLTPPNNAKLIGIREADPGSKVGKTYYYMDDYGNYYYTTDKQLEFERQMIAAQNRMKEAKRRRR